MDWKKIFLIIFIIICVIYIIYLIIIVFFTTVFVNIFKMPESEKERCKEGEKLMSNSSLTFAGLARNSAHAFKENIAFIEYLCTKFKYVNVAILENDSADGTRKLFYDYINELNQSKRVSNLSVKLVNHGKENHVPEYKLDLHRTFTEITPERISKMVNLRNDLNESIKNVFPATDFVYISDLDITGRIGLDGVQNTFGFFSQDSKIDCISYMGVRFSLGIDTVFDPYSFVPYRGYVDKYSIARSNFIIGITLYKGLYRVKSSFGGGFFMRYSSWSKGKYVLRIQQHGKPECEHISFFEPFRCYVNTNMVRNIFRHLS